MSFYNRKSFKFATYLLNEDTKMEIDILKNKVATIIAEKTNVSNKLQAICDLLENKISYYDWVGFYFKNDDKEELKLAQYTGEETAHTIIPFGKGICGQVAVSNTNFCGTRCFRARQLHFLWLEGKIRNCNSYFCKRRKYWTNRYRFTYSKHFYNKGRRTFRIRM
jgi:hypothetical protein